MLDFIDSGSFCLIAVELLVFLCVYVLLGHTEARPYRRVQGKKLVRLEKLQRILSATSFWKKLCAARETEQLKNACVKEMPQVLDVVTLGLSAGLSFDASLDLYCDNYRNVMSQVFKKALMTWRLGSKTRAATLSDLAKDIDIHAFSSFVSAVTQALEFGAPLSGALKGQAASIRDVQRSEIEEQIEKVPVKMLVPLGTLIVPAMLLSILGPLLAGSAIVS